MPEGVGGFPKRDGLEERFEICSLRDNKGVPGIDFLRGAVSYVRDQLGLSAGDFLYEMCEGILASNYPVPDRMLQAVGDDRRPVSAARDDRRRIRSSANSTSSRSKAARRR